MKTSPDPTLTARRLTPLYQMLNDPQRQQLAESLSVRSFQRGELIHICGQTPTHLMYLLSGKVTLELAASQDKNLIIRLVEPGSMFGYREALCGHNYLTNARTDNNTRVVFVPLPLILQFIDNNALVARLFLKDLALLLNHAVYRTSYLQQKHLRGRLAECLLRLKEKYGTKSDGQTLTTYISRKDLANVASMTTSNCIRTLTEFTKEGVISTINRHISILDEDGLRQIAMRS